MVEFGELTDAQRALVDMHALRSAAAALPSAADSHGAVVEFWLRDGERPDAAFDDVRGWAIGNGLPVRRMIDVSNGRNARTRASDERVAALAINARARQLADLIEEVERLLAAALASDARHVADIARRSDEHAAELHQRDVDHAAHTARRSEEHAAELHQRDVRELASEARHLAARRQVEVDQVLYAARRNEEHAAELGLRDRRHDIDVAILSQALESRDVIGQAKGIIMVTTQCTADEAFAILRRQAQAENVEVTEVAAEIANRVTEVAAEIA